MACKLGFVYLLSDLAVWTANPKALNNPNLFPKRLCISLLPNNILQSDRKQIGERKHSFMCVLYVFALCKIQ